MEGKKEKGHASLELYAKIIVTLALITIAEIVVPYVIAHDVNSVIGIGLLAVLAVAKYVLVVMFFMHLYYDQPLCTFLFVTGMVLGGGTMAGLLSAMPHDAYTREEYGGGATTGSSEAKTYIGPELKTPDEKAGEQLFETNCVTCHTLKSVTTATGVIGPDLDGIWERAGKRMPGKTAEQYIDLSIKEPGAFIVDGYPNSMTNFGFDDTKRRQLVAFLMAQGRPWPKGGGGSAPAAGGTEPGASTTPGTMSSPGDQLPATPQPGSGESPTPDTVQESEASPNAGSSPGGSISPAPEGSASPDAAASPAGSATP